MELRRAIIFAKDMDRMTAFYRDGLGLREIPGSREDGWVEFETGGTRLALHAIPAHIARNIEMKSPPEPRADNPIKLVFETDSLQEARAHLTRHGAVMFEPQAWGGCNGLDPEGNVLQIVGKAP